METLNDFLASVHYLNHPLLSFLSGIAVFLLGLYVFLQDKKSKLFLVFLFLNLSISCWFWGNAISMYFFDDFSHALFWYKIGYIGVPFMSVFYYHFYLAYSEKQNKIVYLFYVMAVSEIIFLWFSNVAGNGAIFLKNVGIVYPEINAGAYLKIFGMVKYAVLSWITAISFFSDYKKESDLCKKQKLKYLTGIFFVLVLGIIEWVATFGIHLHIAWIAVPPFAFMMAYAILKYQLMEIRVIVKRAFFYSLGIALVSGVIAGISFLSGWLVESVPGFSSWAIPLAVGGVAFIIGNLFWKKTKEVEESYAVEKKARKELDRMNAMKDELIVVTRHHLSAPVCAIKEHISNLKTMVEKNDLNKEEMRAHLDKTSESTDRLESLIGELLNISKANMRRRPFEADPIVSETSERGNVNPFDVAAGN